MPRVSSPRREEETLGNLDAMPARPIDVGGSPAYT